MACLFLGNFLQVCIYIQEFTFLCRYLCRWTSTSVGRYLFVFLCRAKPVYICGQLVYSVGMVFMAVLRKPAAVIIFSCCAGVMYSTLFTMPYLLVAHYHASETVCTILKWLTTRHWRFYICSTVPSACSLSAIP